MKDRPIATWDASQSLIKGMQDRKCCPAVESVYTYHAQSPGFICQHPPCHKCVGWDWSGCTVTFNVETCILYLNLILLILSSFVLICLEFCETIFCCWQYLIPQLSTSFSAQSISLPSLGLVSYFKSTLSLFSPPCISLSLLFCFYPPHNPHFVSKTIWGTLLRLKREKYHTGKTRRETGSVLLWKTAYFLGVSSP